jgi:hypothetical protein
MQPDYPKWRPWTAERIQEEEQKWETICRKLATANLRNLHIKLFDRGYALPEDTLVEPLRALRVENFTVQFPWPTNYGPHRHDLRSDDGYPFEIKRPSVKDMVTVEFSDASCYPRRRFGLR